MDIGVEISLYPLQADFASVIHQFIDRLNADGRFRVVSNSMSTRSEEHTSELQSP